MSARLVQLLLGDSAKKLAVSSTFGRDWSRDCIVSDLKRSLLREVGIFVLVEENDEVRFYASYAVLSGRPEITRFPPCVHMSGKRET